MKKNAHEILLIDKPTGFSSFQVVRILKKWYEKVGHAGSLDPFASGLLVILTGNQTKKFIDLQAYDKEYVGEIMLGISTNTYDISGEVIKKSEKLPQEAFSLNNFNELAEQYVGEIEQRPPSFSAVKQAGRKLYELARKGIECTPSWRRVLVKSFSFNAFQMPILKFTAVVGKGVYIRSLANDFGTLLGCGAVLVSLRRLRIGEYSITEAKNFGDLLNTVSWGTGN